MKILKYALPVFIVLAVIYFLGPRPNHADLTDGLPSIPDTSAALEQWVAKKESAFKLKPDNQARIVWFNDSLKQRTRYVVLYLHGFTASQEEGDPVHVDFAKKIGANLYLSRLMGHGIDTTEALYDMTADGLWESAKEAYAIAKKLGDSVIIMGTSTGGTLALMLAAEHYPGINGLVLMSPNIAINNPLAWMLNNPWGLQIGRQVMHGNTITAKDTRPIYRQYWSTPYRIESATQVEQLLEQKMNHETFKQVTQPLLLLYYYKDEVHQDSVVKVSAMLQMYESLGTAAELKKKVAIPGAGDHVMGSYIKSGDIPSVEREAEVFARERGWIKGE